MTEIKPVSQQSRQRESRISERTRHDKYNDKCVCQICTCGTHRCPKGQQQKFQGITTNAEFYKDYKIEKQPQSPITYKINQRKYDPESLQTSYKLQYTPKQIQPFQAQKEIIYTPKKTQFYSDTEYKTRYQKNEIKYEPEPKYEYKPNKHKFEGTTSYKAQFQPKKMEVNNPEQIQYERKKIPFTGESSYKQQFKQYKVHVEKPQQYKYQPNRTKFTGQSHYRQQYPEYDRSAYLQQKCPVYQLPPAPRQCSPGKSHLHYSLQKNIWN